MTRWMKYILIAVQFLTRLPVNIKGEVSLPELGAAAAAFPIAGILVGGVLALVYYVSASILPAPVAVFLTVTGLVFITGGLHLDGLMDTADGIFSGKGRERMLEIMKDSRVGAMGVIACVLLLGGKLLLITQLDSPWIFRVLLIFPVLSRWMLVWALAGYPYARVGEGTGRLFCDHVSIKEVAIATVITLVYVIALGGYAGALLVAGAAAAGLGTTYFLSNRLGGLTGDTYGATNEIVEVVVLLVGVAIAYNGWLIW